MDTFNVFLSQFIVYTSKDLSGAGMVMFQRMEFGVYGLTIANFMSLLAGHYVREVHRRNEIVQEKLSIQEARTLDAQGEAIDTSGESLSNHISLASRHGALKRAWVLGSLFVAAGLLIWGWTITSMQFEFHGPLGKIISPEPRFFSFLDFFREMPNVSEEPGAITGRWWQIIFLILTLVSLIFDQLVLLVLWVWPMTLKVQTFMLSLHQILHCWSCCEVMLLATALMTDDPKNNPDPIMRQIGNVVILKLGFWLMLASVLITTITGIVMNKSCEKLLKMRRLNGLKLALNVEHTDLQPSG